MLYKCLHPKGRGSFVWLMETFYNLLHSTYPKHTRQLLGIRALLTKTIECKLLESRCKIMTIVPMLSRQDWSGIQMNKMEFGNMSHPSKKLWCFACGAGCLWCSPWCQFNSKAWNWSRNSCIQQINVEEFWVCEKEHWWKCSWPSMYWYWAFQSGQKMSDNSTFELDTAVLKGAGSCCDDSIIDINIQVPKVLIEKRVVSKTK